MPLDALLRCTRAPGEGQCGEGGGGSLCPPHPRAGGVVPQPPLLTSVGRCSPSRPPGGQRKGSAAPQALALGKVQFLLCWTRRSFPASSPVSVEKIGEVGGVSVLACRDPRGPPTGCPAPLHLARARVHTGTISGGLARPRHSGTLTLGTGTVAMWAGGGQWAACWGALVLAGHQQLLRTGHLPLQRPGLARHFGDGGRPRRHGTGQRLGAAPRFGGALGRHPPVVRGRKGPDPAVQCPRQRPAGCRHKGRCQYRGRGSTPVPPLPAISPPSSLSTPSLVKCCDVPDSDKLSSDGSSSRSPTSGTCGGEGKGEWPWCPHPPPSPGKGTWPVVAMRWWCGGCPHLVRGLP